MHIIDTNMLKDKKGITEGKNTEAGNLLLKKKKKKRKKKKEVTC